ncbi:alpha/beta fold hydrolase [Nonomuraea sp. NEAU-A123]|uniref:alpha/beta fold hydrolase n=1 Tax=Nonomuraea sp. NEAU-A123 TaxID=2839649 RepID=UPI001BE44AA0|nr:alpha/beta fold hydrolase [Nonomuraea sp. NEAU-A123]MBT2234208.1 alpha/beta fold hydrolase [Nonomuraea sp. NEAU-A123]
MRSTTEKALPTLVLVHGAWHGAWAWDPVVPLLTEAGLSVRAVQLSGLGRGPGRHDLAGHAAFLRSELAALDGPVTLCGHSYGGAVITEAAAGAPNVASLIYLTAFLLEAGESCADANALTPAPADPALGPTAEGDYLHVSEAAARHLFYGGCSPEQVAAATGRLTPEHIGTVTAPATRAAWHEIPSTYIVCARDVALSPQAQRAMAGRATRRAEIGSAHSPMLSHPRELTALLTEAVRYA